LFGRQTRAEGIEGEIELARLLGEVSLALGSVSDATAVYLRW
jgi:hypothetical protein